MSLDSSLCFDVWPFGGRDHRCHLLWPLLTSARSRHASLQGALRGLMGYCRFARLEIGQLDLAPGGFGSGPTKAALPSAPRRQGAQISPSKNVNFPGTSAAFTLPPEPLGLVVLCQLAPQAGPSLCGFCPSPRTFALRLPSDHPSRSCPCLRLVVTMCSL